MCFGGGGQPTPAPVSHSTTDDTPEDPTARAAAAPVQTQRLARPLWGDAASATTTPYVRSLLQVAK